MGLFTNLLASSGSSTLKNPQPWFIESLVGVRSASGKFVTHQTALRASAVLACINILYQDIATLPLQLKENTDTGARVATDHELYPLLHDLPNDEMTAVEVRGMNVLDLFLHGAFYNQVVRTNGAVTSIVPLSAQGMITRRLDNGDLEFRWTDPLGGQTRTFTKDQIWRGNIMSQFGIEGRSLVLLAREAIGLLLAMEEQAGRFYANGAQTMGFLKTPDGVTLEEPQRKQLVEDFSKNYGGSGNAWKTALLELGITYERMAPTPQESQQIESRNFQLADIARIFRIPGVMLGIKETATYASAEQFYLAYVKHTILPLTIRIEQTITRDLLLPNERTRFFAKHNLAGLLRADIKTRYEAYGIAIKDGWLARAEVRETEEYDERTGLEKFLIPAQVGILEEDGSVTTITPAVAPPAKASLQMHGADSESFAKAERQIQASLRMTNRLRVLATANADRVVRKEVKMKTSDYNAEHAKWVAEVIQISLEKAEQYCKEAAGTVPESHTGQLVSLAMET